YLTYSLSGASFPRESFAAVGRLVPDLQRFEPASARDHVQSLLVELDGETDGRPRLANRFALLHPDRVRAAAIGSPGGWPVAPVAQAEGNDLPYPIGIADVAQLTGE
ncbi:MAG TPA: hypothetical protein PKE04_21240, partial [Clostridia bacterium]|nr:hypothetical protein [Clostridia bacterium]